MSGDVTEAMLLKTSDSEAMCLTEAFNHYGWPAVAVVARQSIRLSLSTLQHCRLSQLAASNRRVARLPQLGAEMTDWQRYDSDEAMEARLQAGIAILRESPLQRLREFMSWKKF